MVTGFIGATHLAVLLIKIGAEYTAPHPYHGAQLTVNVGGLEPVYQ